MRRRRFISVFLLLLLGGVAIYIVTTRIALGDGSATWREVAPGMALRTWTLPARDHARVVVVRAEIARCAIRAVDAHGGVDDAGSSASTVCPTPGAAINANFFVEDLTPIGALVIDGESRTARTTQIPWGTLLLRDGQPEIVLSTGKSLPRGVTQAVAGTPRLVIDGRIPSFKSTRTARRSAVGLDAAGHLYLAATADYLTLRDWATFLRDTLGCRQALNLDGGSSTQLTVRGNVEAQIDHLVQVPVFLTVAPREDER